MSRYVVITPACNEASYIGLTIESVVAQTLRPVLWVIVDDGSTDETAEVVKEHCRANPWISYVYREKQPGQSYFGSNVYAITEGYTRIRDLSFEYIGILDADITLPAEYYETILGRLRRDLKLGIASGVYENLFKGKVRPVLNDRRSTPKAIMVFRREVYGEIGGFLPLEYGGEDTAACIMARMRGWKTWSFPDIKAIHHRPTGTGNAGGLLRARYVQGLAEYGIGSHPLFVIGKTIKRMIKEPPLLVGGLARLAGYLAGAARQKTRDVPDEVVRFYRNEQIERILGGNRVPDDFRPCLEEKPLLGHDGLLEDRAPKEAV